MATNDNDPFWDEPRITEAIQRAVRDAVEEHRLLGNPIAVWRDGKVVWLQPEEIPVRQADRQETDDR